MSQALFRFYAELNDFFPPERRQIAFPHTFAARASIKSRVSSV